MAYNSFREAICIPNELQSNNMIFFDRDVLTSSDYKATTEALEKAYQFIGVPTDKDIDYVDDPQDANYGAFAIKMPGPIIIAWTASQLTGRSLDGTFLEIRYREFSHYTDPGTKTGPVFKDWQPLGASAVLKNSATDGMGCIWAALHGDPSPGAKRCLRLGPRMERLYIGIFNSSDNTIKVNREHYMKASIIMFGIGKMGGLEKDLREILRFIEEDLPVPSYIKTPNEVRSDMANNEDIDHGQNERIAGSGGLKQLYTEGRSAFDKLTTITTPVTLLSPRVPGLGVSVISVGNLHNFWSYGFVNTIHPITIDPEPGELGEVKVYFGETESGGRVNYEPLKWFRSETAAVGMCYVTGSSPENDFIPIYIDKTGVYLRVPAGYSFRPGSTFNFVRGVILSPPLTSDS